MRYRIHQASFIDDKLVPAGTEITLSPIGRDKASGAPLHHKPGPHWEPLDEAAKAHAEASRHVFTGEVPDAVEAMTAQLNEAMRQGGNDALAKSIAEAVSQSVASAVAAAMGAAIERLAAPQPTDHAALVAAVSAGVAAALGSGRGKRAKGADEGTGDETGA